MPRVGMAYALTNTNPHTQLSTGGGNTAQTLTLEKDCVAVLVSGQGTGTNLAYVTFDNSTPSASNGIVISPTSSPVLIPLGYNANPANHNLKVIGSAATTLLNVVQMS